MDVNLYLYLLGTLICNHFYPPFFLYFSNLSNILYMVEYLIIFLPLNTRYFCWNVGSTWSYPIPWPNILKIIAFITPKSIIISCILCSLCYGASNIMYVMIIWDGSDLNETGIIQVSCKLLRFPPPYHIFILISFIMVHQMFLDFTFLVVCYFFTYFSFIMVH